VWRNSTLLAKNGPKSPSCCNHTGNIRPPLTAPAGRRGSQKGRIAPPLSARSRAVRAFIQLRFWRRVAIIQVGLGRTGRVDASRCRRRRARARCRPGTESGPRCDQRSRTRPPFAGRPQAAGAIIQVGFRFTDRRPGWILFHSGTATPGCGWRPTDKNTTGKSACATGARTVGSAPPGCADCVTVASGWVSPHSLRLSPSRPEVGKPDHRGLVSSWWPEYTCVERIREIRWKQSKRC
jgi:hypothetical protein